jgi:hypothetical protein
VAGSSSGPVGDKIGVSAWGGWDGEPGDGTPDADRFRYTVGRAARPGRHRVVHPGSGETLEVTAGDGGWWAHIRRLS